MVNSFLFSAGIGLRRGAAKGWRGFVWMLKIILPVSLLTFLLDFSGCLAHLDGLLEPLMGAIHLPAMAALPLLVGLLTGIYGGIAAMTVLPFTVQQMTLMAVFLLIAHSLIQEGLVQHHSGCPMWMATANRLVAAALTVFAMGWLLGPETARETAGMSPAATMIAFWPALQNWGADMAELCLKMLLIILVLMMGMELAKQYRLIEKVLRLIEPFLGLLGLDRQVGHAVVDGRAAGDYLRRRADRGRGSGGKTASGSVENTACLHWHQSRHAGRPGRFSSPWAFTPFGFGFRGWSWR